MSIAPRADSRRRLQAFINNFMTAPRLMNWMKRLRMVKVSVRVAAMSWGKSLIWADKVALGVAAVIAGGTFFIWLLAAIALKSVFDGSFNRYMLEWTADAELAVALPLWLGLRAIDYAVNRRRHLSTDQQHAPKQVESQK